MDPKTTITLLGYMEVAACLATLVAVVAKKQWSDHWALGSFLITRAMAGSIGLVLPALLQHAFLTVHVAYKAWFYSYWISAVAEAILTLIVINSVFRLAMAPLKGLQTLGMIIFRWAAAISVAVALGSTFGPGLHGKAYLVAALSQLQRTQSILTICLLIFVCFAIRPMGLSFSSRIFGISLGLGFISTNDLVQSAWIALHHNMYQTASIVNGLVSCLALLMWTAYFALPEPKRRLIVLPTTSPFLRWNQISQALGDSPGFVAVGGVPPDIFAPAELEVIRRASAKTVAQFPKSLGA